MSMKERALSAIEKLPADTDFDQIIDQIIDHIRMLALVREAEEQSRAGKTIPHDEVKAELESWAGK